MYSVFSIEELRKLAKTKGMKYKTTHTKEDLIWLLKFDAMQEAVDQAWASGEMQKSGLFETKPSVADFIRIIADKVKNGEI